MRARGMDGHPAHGCSISFCKGEPQEGTHVERVGIEHFVEIAQAKEQDRIRMLCPNGVVLTHERGI